MSYKELRAQQRAAFREAAAPKPRAYVLNKRGANPVEVTKIIRLEFNKVLNDLGQMSFRVPIDDVTAPMLADAHPDASIPVVLQVGHMESMWFATHVTEAYVGGDEYLAVTCVSPERHLQGLFAWPNPGLAPELQISKVDLAVGPLALIIKNTVLNPNFARMGRKTGQRIHYVAPHKGADDYTRQTIIGVRMNESLDLIKDLIDHEGLTLTYRVYLPGRGQQPPAGHPAEYAALIWDVEARAKLPAGGLLWQGIMRSVKEFWSDAWDTLTGFNDYDASTEAVPYWGEPQMILRRSQYDDLEITSVKPTASTYTVGGRSQEMVNDLISHAIKGLLSYVSGALGIFADITGLDEIMDDRLFAYHSFDDRKRRERMGAFGFFEQYKPSVGLSLDALLLLRELQYKSRASRSHEVALGGSGAFTPGEEFDVGTMLALELPRDRWVVSFVTEIGFTYTVEDDARWEIQVADRPRRNPVDSTLNALRGLASLVNKVTLTE